MVKQILSPEYFKKVAETIWRHNWQGNNPYRRLFAKFIYIFDIKDVNEFNIQCEEFEDKIFFSPMDADQHIESFRVRGKGRRIRLGNGDKVYIYLEDVLKVIENILRWCQKRLNEYYKAYGISIEGIDVSNMDMEKYN